MVYCTVAGVVPGFTRTSDNAPQPPPQVVLPVTVPLVTVDAHVNVAPGVVVDNVGL